MFEQLLITKPLLKKYSVLAVQNLYSYHCFIETLKILKFRTPRSLYSLYTFSIHNDMYLIPNLYDKQFLYQSSVIWNIIRKKIGISDFSCNISSVKISLIKSLNVNQNQHDELNWLTSHDFDIKRLKFKKLDNNLPST